MAITRNPLFQNALLKRQARAVATGGRLNTEDISAAVAGRDARMQSAFEDIALHRKGRKQNKKQFKQKLRLQKRELRDREQELPWRIGLGLGTSALAGYMGYQNRQALERQAHEQRLMTSTLNNQLEEQILMRELLMGRATPGFLMGGEEQ